jgi:hypothetical protein
MKFVIPAFIMIAVITSCKAQKPAATNNTSRNAVNQTHRPFTGDTLQYIENAIINNKQLFIGKPLNTLLDSLQLEVRSYNYGAVPINNKITDVIGLSFVSAKESLDRMLSNNKNVFLSAIWETPLPLDTVIALTRKTHSEWTPEAKAYFGSHVIKELVVTRYKN